MRTPREMVGWCRILVKRSSEALRQSTATRGTKRWELAAQSRWQLRRQLLMSEMSACGKAPQIWMRSSSGKSRRCTMDGGGVDFAAILSWPCRVPGRNPEDAGSHRNHPPRLDPHPTRPRLPVQARPDTSSTAIPYLLPGTRCLLLPSTYRDWDHLPLLSSSFPMA